MFQLSTSLTEVPSDVYENSSWFLYYIQKLNYEKIRKSNRDKVNASVARQAPPRKKMLGGAALLRELSKYS